LKKKNNSAILRVVFATGISSVVTQLLTIREFLTQFQGNEIVIALILFNWLILGGIGTMLARLVSRGYWQARINRLVWLSIGLAGVPTLQILAIRIFRDVFFIHGSSVGFYPTLAYTFFLITPYSLLVGFVLPYSLFVLRTQNTGYPGARIYIIDNLGDVAGGALFSFILVFVVTPMQAILLANLPLLAVSFMLFRIHGRPRAGLYLGLALVLMVLISGLFLESPTVATAKGKLVHYQDSLYGRITVYQDQEQFTLFEDGTPVFSSQNLVIAEETIHYPLAQLDSFRHILLISAQGGVMAELEKYRPARVDYVELNPAVTAVLLRFGLIKKISGLNIIHRDGRAFLAKTKSRYDAIIVNLPEPDTFQINRFYTDQFFKLVKDRLTAKGVLSFSMQGFDNYLAEPQRLKLSSLYNTVARYFEHVLLLPGQKIYFICSDEPVNQDIPARLASTGISTEYIKGFFYGNLTAERIKRLNGLVDPTVAKNYDKTPHLMRLMFFQWFAKYATSPHGFVIVLAVLCLIYLVRITREEFVLFSTGCMTMGSEILVIFAFQIFFGYIYFQIGIIITVFLAGLLPGAIFGNKLADRGTRLLALSDGLLILLLGIFLVALITVAERLPALFFLVFGFMVSLICGFQFPVALRIRGDDNPAATRFFSADLIGAASGTLFTSVFLIPYFGILWATAGLIGLKLMSLIVVGTAYGKTDATTVSFL
jgi:spermidine synthase